MGLLQTDLWGGEDAENREVGPAFFIFPSLSAQMLSFQALQGTLGGNAAMEIK